MINILLKQTCFAYRTIGRLSMENKTKQIYLSYSYKDFDIIKKIMDVLLKNNIKLSNIDNHVTYNEDLSLELENKISSSDYMVVFMSSNYSKWQEYETYIGFEKYLSKRDITIIPVLLDKVAVPDKLNTFLYIDFTKDFDKGLNALVRQLKNTNKIDFSMLNGYQFDKLIADLLQEIGFSNIERNINLGNTEIDIICDYKYQGPFGDIRLETWMVEVKLYQNSRLDVKSIQQIKNQFLSNANFDKALVVTNGYLTSPSKEALDFIKSKENIDIKVIEGSELKRLLLINSALIDKYFA